MGGRHHAIGKSGVESTRPLTLGINTVGPLNIDIDVLTISKKGTRSVQMTRTRKAPIPIKGQQPQRSRRATTASGLRHARISAAEAAGVEGGLSPDPSVAAVVRVCLRLKVVMMRCLSTLEDSMRGPNYF